MEVWWVVSVDATRIDRNSVTPCGIETAKDVHNAHIACANLEWYLWVDGRENA